MDVGALARRIRDHRLAADLSREALAAKARVSPSYIKKLEDGAIQRPGGLHLDSLAQALGFVDGAALTREGGARSQALLPVPSMEPNVRGRLEDLRVPGVQPLPIYRWGSCGDPRSSESAPDPDRLEYPPLGRELLIGPNGFGVEIQGESMSGRGIHDGDLVWVNPDRSVRQGGVVLALVEMDGEPGMVVKVLSSSAGAIQLTSAGEGDEGRANLLATHVTVIGSVVWVSPRGFPPR